MIRKIGFLHYLSETTYKSICRKFGLNDEEQKTKDNSMVFENGKILKIDLYNIVYKQFGHIWFMHIDVDFPGFCCTYNEFSKKLYEAYNDFFGEDIANDFWEYEKLNCDYIEYSTIFEVNDASAVISKLKEKCPPEQTEKALWDNFKKPHATIEFCFAKKDDTQIETLARCHGSAIKKRIKDKKLHRITGVTPIIVINSETEKEITDWLWHRFV